MNKHELRTKQKKDSIINATINLVSTLPFDLITINKIKKEAKVSQVTIYKHFGSKENLINEAIKCFAVKAISSIMEVLTSDVAPKKRLEGYFRASFNIALSHPLQREIVEYIFSGANKELMDHVSGLYFETYPALERLYNDTKKENLIRDSLSFEQFLKMCDAYTRIQPQFYSTKEEMDAFLESLVKSFS